MSADTTGKCACGNDIHEEPMTSLIQFGEGLTVICDPSHKGPPSHLNLEQWGCLNDE